MPLSQTPVKAEDRKLYVATTLPATLTDPTLYQLVGLQTGSPVGRVKGGTDVKWKGGNAKIFATTQFTQTVGVLVAADVDDGQVILRNAQVSGARIFCLLTSNISGSAAQHYGAQVGGGQEGDGTEGALSDSFDIAVIGTPVTFVVA